MVRALLWKEFRDQAAILIALLVMGTGVIATAATLGSSSNLDAGIRDFRAYTNAGRLAVLVLTMAAGVVVGGSLFAGERENETFEFLERLPLTRWKIWRTKIAAGAILATISGIVLISLGLLLGTLGSSGSQTVWVAFAIVLAIVAFAWGPFGSVICDSTLAACGLGLIGAGFLGSIILPVTAVIVYAVLGLTPYSSGIRGELPALAGMYMVAAIPLLFSAILFIAPDQSRYRPRVLVEATAPTPVRARYVLPSWLAPWVALVWLFWRQSRIYLIIGVVLATIAGIAGMPFLFIVWPIGSLIAGTLAGVLNWDDEQTKGSNRYWGERRIPTLKLWLVKLVASFGQMVLCCVPLIGFALIRQVMQLLRSYNWRENPEILPATLSSGLLVDGGAQVYYYLLIWPLYGFAFGHVVGCCSAKRSCRSVLRRSSPDRSRQCGYPRSSSVVCIIGNCGRFRCSRSSPRFCCGARGRSIASPQPVRSRRSFSPHCSHCSIPRAAWRIAPSKRHWCRKRATI